MSGIKDGTKTTVMTSPSPTWVAAIDIGTSHSSYAYSSKTSPNDVGTSQFRGGAGRTPTSILLNKDKSFIAYGQEAEDVYQTMLKQNNSNLFLFKEFKMEIHDNPSLSLSKSMATDVSGKCKLQVMKLLTIAIQYLKNHLVKALNTSKDTYCEDDIHFVLTCPAIWSDRAKYFLRHAATKAGIKSESLTLAYDSECVALWCKMLQLGNQGTISLRTSGTKYAVVDIGGGVVDISYHESAGNMAVNTLYPARGGVWGGVVVDKCFITYLSLIFGPASWAEFQRTNPAELFKLMKGFEATKRSIAKQSETIVKIAIPRPLLDLALKHFELINYKQLSEKIESSFFGKHLKLINETLEIDSEFTLAMFDYTVKEIGHALHDSSTGCETVVLTGEFAGVVKKKLKDLLNGQKVIVPPDNRLFVAMGAVLYGHNPEHIKTRIPNLTYGIKATVPYNENRHSGGETTIIRGEKMCTNYFHVLLKAGTKVNIGYELKELDKPLLAEDKSQIFEIFSCGKDDTIPTLTSDPTVTPVAKFSLPLPFGSLVEDKIFERCFIFGETEIKCRITYKKGKLEPTTFHMEFK